MQQKTPPKTAANNRTQDQQTRGRGRLDGQKAQGKNLASGRGSQQGSNTHSRQGG